MSNDWQKKYAKKIRTTKAALANIKPGDRLFVGSACGEPQMLMEAMSAQVGSMTDTEVVQVLSLGVAAYADPKYSASIRPNAFFIGNNIRGAVNEARADYTPIFLSQVPRLFKSGQMPIDVAMVMVSEPDEKGNCSLGVSVDITKSAVECADVVIAQVNKHMPYANGDCLINIEDIDAVIPHDEPLLEWSQAGASDEVTQQIAEHIADLVPDGSTLQLGIGSLPDAILAHMKDKKNLGIHTEMFSDGVMELVKAGVITNTNKTHLPGKIVGSFAAGSRELFEWMDKNPDIEMRPSEYTNDPFIIAQHDNMVAINSALEIDLTGQVCADSLGQQFYSGIGGHADFMRGAALAKNGKTIIAMASTAMTEKGMISRISANLHEGAGVITTRGDVQYVVTEYGVAMLYGKTLRQRALSLIGIAHPDFRSELLYAAKRRRLVYANQILPPPSSPYPEELEKEEDLTDGSTVMLRPIRPEDENMMRDMFYSFSEKTRYLRYHNMIKGMPHDQMQVFCNVDHTTEVAIIGTTGAMGNEEVVAVGRYYVSEDYSHQASMAFVVRDDWQRKGLGTKLFERLLEIAVSRGITDFYADVLPENAGMLKIFQRAEGMDVTTTNEGGVVAVRMTKRNGDS